MLTPESFKIMSEPIQKEIEIIKKKITKLENNKNQIKTTVKKIPDYTDKIKELLNLDKPSRDLMFAIIDRIEIDQYRNVEIKYKFNLIEQDSFRYKEPVVVRKPRKRKGKTKKK